MFYFLHKYNINQDYIDFMCSSEKMLQYGSIQKGVLFYIICSLQETDMLQQFSLGVNSMQMSLMSTLKIKDPVILLAKSLFRNSRTGVIWDKQNYGQPQASPKRKRKGQPLLGFRWKLGRFFPNKKFMREE